MGAVVPWEWDDTTEAPGGAEEANRRWPEGRGEQGREQGKGHPSSGVFEGRCRDEVGRGVDFWNGAEPARPAWLSRLKTSQANEAKTYRRCRAWMSR